jgi:predicted lipid-binding transport protein (Tim44 family)
MGVVKIEGKSVTLDDAIIKAGPSAIIDALSVDFPDVEEADIEVESQARVGAPVTATVVKKGTHKGQGERLPRVLEEVAEVLARKPDFVNPAIALATRIIRAEAAGDAQALEEATRPEVMERAIAIGEREGRAVQQALAVCMAGEPVAAEEVPVGF